MSDDSQTTQEQHHEVIIVAEEDTPRVLKQIYKGTRIPEAKKALVHALKAKGKTHRVIRAETGLAYYSIVGILRKDKPDPLLVEQIKKEIGKKYLIKADQCLDSITEEKMSEASGYQLTGMSKLLLEAGRLHEGESTQNIDVQSLTCDLLSLDDQLQAKSKLLAEARAYHKAKALENGGAKP